MPNDGDQGVSLNHACYGVSSIGVIHSPFKQKFGIPRQSRLVDVVGEVELYPPFNQEEAFVGIEQSSHIWLLFLFTEHIDKQTKLSVRPPRLGGNERIGVFATRSSFRPNAIGMSLVRLEKVINDGGKVSLQVSGVDLLDGTQVIDIKPYVPYADCEPIATHGFASLAPDEQALDVQWQPEAVAELAVCYGEAAIQIQQQISQLIGLDPRPAYHDQERSYGLLFAQTDIQWRCMGKKAIVDKVIKVTETT